MKLANNLYLHYNRKHYSFGDKHVPYAALYKRITRIDGSIVQIRVAADNYTMGEIQAFLLSNKATGVYTAYARKTKQTRRKFIVNIDGDNKLGKYELIDTLYGEVMSHGDYIITDDVTLQIEYTAKGYRNAKVYEKVYSKLCNSGYLDDMFLNKNNVEVH